MVPLSKFGDGSPIYGGKIWIETNGSCSYQCKFCHFKFSSSNLFEDHLSSVHNHEIRPNTMASKVENRRCSSHDVNQSNQPNIDVQVIVRARSPFPCVNRTNLDYGRPNQSGVKDRKQEFKHFANPKHIGSKIREAQEVKNALTCTKCGSKYATLESLRAHNRRRHSFDCICCPRDGVKTFETEKGLWAHQKNHHPDRFPYRCKVCPRAFKHSGELKEHIGAIHARGNDVKCDFCSKVLMSVYEKENHIKQQHRDRRYHCGLCNDYKTISQVNLRRHTKEKHPGQSQPLSF